MKILDCGLRFKVQSLRSAQRFIVKPPAMLDRAFRCDAVEQGVDKVHKGHFEVGAPQLHCPREDQTTEDNYQDILPHRFKVLRQDKLFA